MAKRSRLAQPVDQIATPVQTEVPSAVRTKRKIADKPVTKSASSSQPRVTGKRPQPIRAVEVNAEPHVPPIVVFKLGGSLLDLDDLADRSRWLLESIPACRPLFVVGGGPAADVVRLWHDQHHLRQTQSHWLAIRSLTITAALFCELLPGATIARNRDEANRLWQAGQFPVLEPYAFLQAEQPLQPLPLPCCWDTTTDSIAAWTASVWPASMLVLAKSVELPTDITGPQAVQQGLIDAELLNLLDFVPPVAWVNLRAELPVLTTWLRRNQTTSPTTSASGSHRLGGTP